MRFRHLKPTLSRYWVKEGEIYKSEFAGIGVIHNKIAIVKECNIK